MIDRMKGSQERMEDCIWLASCGFLALGPNHSIISESYNLEANALFCDVNADSNHQAK